jgi:cell wall-associated NlpC family hydrolase
VRRLTLTLSSVFLAVGLSLSIALSVNAQATSDQYAPEDPVQPESTTQEPSSEASALEASSTDGFVSQGSLPGAYASAEEIAAMEPSEPYSQVVDNATKGRFQAPGWKKASSNPDGYGKDYAVAQPSERTKSAKFKVKIPADDYYTLYAWWPAEANNNAATHFGVGTVSGVEWTKVDQRRDNGFWVRIGAYKLEAGDRVVQVAPGPRSKGYAVADAVQVVRGTQVPPSEASYEEPAGGEGEFTTAATRREGRRIVRVARNHIGTPYRLSPPYPCRSLRKEDCSCHTKVVYRRFDVPLPDNPRKQWRRGQKVAKSNLRRGDLVFFKEGRSRVITHVGIYSGNGNMVHASRYWKRVVEKPMRYVDGYFGAKRINLR